MLNYTKRNNYIIALVITICICIILFTVLDMNILKNTNMVNNTEIAKYKEYSFGQRIPKEVMSIEDTYLKIMQIADIYENVAIEISEDNAINNMEEYLSDIKNSVWRIEIPKIGVVAPIQSGTTQNILGKAVGHFEESAKWKGNVALAGHNRGYQCNFFENIKKLNSGDKIIYYSQYGKKEYKVILNKIIKQTDWSYVQDTKDNRITLITCVENMHEYRRCVQAIEII